MLDLKKEIAVAIAKATNIEESEIYGYIEVPKDNTTVETEPKPVEYDNPNVSSKESIESDFSVRL